MNMVAYTEQQADGTVRSIFEKTHLVEPPKEPFPSEQKYGSLLLKRGFTQYPNQLDQDLFKIGVKRHEFILVRALLKYRWRENQEIFPSVQTLAEECQCTTRHVRSMTSRLENIGLLKKMPRYVQRSQVSNYYDLEELLTRCAALHSPELTTILTEQKAHKDEPFVPADGLENAITILDEQYNHETTPAQLRYNVVRLQRRYERSELNWDEFVNALETAAGLADNRQNKLTRRGHQFTQLIPYFFSALDRVLFGSGSTEMDRMLALSETETEALPDGAEPVSSTSPRQVPAAPEAHVPTQPDRTNAGQGSTLAARRAQRRAAEKVGRHKKHAPTELRVLIEDISREFHNHTLVTSNVQQTANLYYDARISEPEMLDLIQQARGITQQRHVQKRNEQGQFNRMPYFFKVLTGLTEQVIASQEAQESL